MKSRQLPLSGDVYLEVVRALSHASAATPAARDLLVDPSRVLNGLTRDMHNVGVSVDVHFLNRALLVFKSSMQRVEVRRCYSS